MRIATHNAEFHADEVFGLAILLSLHSDAEIVRTRDQAVLATADIVLDVGTEYEAARGRLDHHMKGGAGTRENGVPFASAGLVWLHFGAEYLKTVAPDGLDMERLHADVDRKLIQGIDAVDVGAVNTTAVLRDEPHQGEAVMVRSLSEAIAMHNGNVEFEDMCDDAQMDRFRHAVEMAQRILLQVVRGSAAVQLWENRVASADKGEPVLVLDQPCPDVGCPWIEEVCRRGHIHFVVFPASDQKSWRIKAAPVTPGSFEVRKSLPEAWAGKRGTELDAVAGISGGIFVHPGRWIGGANNREAVVELARQASVS